jgi:PAS domain S-box-containing protein
MLDVSSISLSPAMWPFLTILALAAAVGIPFLVAQKFLRQQRQVQAEMEELQRRQQQTTIDAKAQQQVLFNSMLEGLLLLDRNRRIYLANRAFKNLFGLKTELRGKTIMEALRLHELATLVERVESDGQVFDYELKLPELSERWLQVNAAAISNSAGEREGTILVFHDLTRLKQLERTREEFVANVSHELRTPLSLIKGYVETLLDGARNDPEVAERFLKIIERNASRLDLLIQDLLAISALESGRIKLNLQPVPLRPLAEKVLADLKTARRREGRETRQRTARTHRDGGREPARTGPRQPRGQRHQIWPRGWHGHRRRKKADADKLEILCRTTGRAFRPNRSTACSSGFTAWTRRGRASRAARAWVCPSSSTSCKPRRQGLGEKRVGQGRDVFLHAAACRWRSGKRLIG